MKSKKGMLILGYNISEPNWEETVWGTPPHKPGRLPRGIAVMLEEDVELVVLVSSAFSKEGKSTGEWMKERIYQGINGEFQQFTIYPLSQISPGRLKRLIDERLVVVDAPVKNTFEELAAAGSFFRDAGVQSVFLITSPDHISRTIRDAVIAWREYPQLTRNLYGTPSVTFYAKRSPEDAEIARMENVVIAEPPVARVFNLARVFRVLKNPDALAELDRCLKKYNA